jgi:hypothetical protein
MPYKIGFKLPTRTEHLYYSRDEEIQIDGRATTRPFLTPISEARVFNNTDSAISFRDYFCAMYKNEKYAIWIEDHLGNKLFERDAAPAETGALDTRTRLFVVPV